MRWPGAVTLMRIAKVDEPFPGMSVRIPGWSENATSTPNGEPLDVFRHLMEGYACIDVASAAGKTALQWGPVVVCLEGIDHHSPVRSLALLRSTELSARPDRRTGTVALHAAAAPTPTPELYATTVPRNRAENLTAVPYFSWADRGQCDMTVWIRAEAPAKAGRSCQPCQ